MLTAFMPKMKSILIVAFLHYIGLRQHISEYGRKIQDKYPTLKAIHDRICYFFLFFKAKLESRKIEPFANNWVLLSGHYRVKESLFGLFQNEYTYTTLYPSQTQSMSECARVYNLSIHLANSKLYSNYAMHECDLIMKVQNRRLIRVFKREIPSRLNIEPEELFEQSRVKFISIELVFPYKEKSYVIDLDKSVYLRHNEILSYGFLSRYLDHHYGTGLMEDDYLLNIMDNNMETVQLKTRDYIVLDRNSYKIVRLEQYSRVYHKHGHP
jgi:hypothetical protein